MCWGLGNVTTLACCKSKCTIAYANRNKEAKTDVNVQVYRYRKIRAFSAVLCYLITYPAKVNFCSVLWRQLLVAVSQ